jgi:hypothetical protein
MAVGGAEAVKTEKRSSSQGNVPHKQVIFPIKRKNTGTVGSVKAGYISEKMTTSEQVSYSKSCINNYCSTVTLQVLFCKSIKVLIVIRRNRYRPLIHISNA